VSSSKTTDRFVGVAVVLVVFVLYSRFAPSDGPDSPKDTRTASSDTSQRPKTFSITVAQLPAEAANPTIVITPSGATDEKEFLLYNYRKLRTQLPAAFSVRGDSRARLDAFRDRVNRFNEYVKDHIGDAKLGSLYANLLGAVDITSDYATQLDRVDRGILARQTEDSTKNIFDASYAGGYAAGTAAQNGYSRGDAALAGILAGAATYLFDELRKRQVLDEAKIRAFEDASDDFKRKLSVADARESNLIADFAEQYHWRTDARGRRIDQFTALEAELADTYQKTATPEAALRVCQSLLEAARRVPNGALYDEHRGYALFFAARLATWAADRDRQDLPWGPAHSPAADFAVRLCDATLRYWPDDSDGTRRSQRGWALACAGRFDEAQKQANEVFELRKSDRGFLYLYACLWSSAGRPDQLTLRNLADVIAGGEFTSDLDWEKAIPVMSLKQDPNLQALRNAFPTDFSNLFQVRFDWSIDWGLFSDEVVLVNKSAFPLTKIKLTAKLTSPSSGDWGPREFEAAMVSPGQSIRWNVSPKITARGSDIQGNATLTCDQDKPRS
jgi:hypothetical protein